MYNSYDNNSNPQERFDPNFVCAMNDYKFDENIKFSEINNDNELETIAKDVAEGNLYQKDFDTYIAPYLKQNSDTDINIMPVPIPFDTGINDQIFIQQNRPTNEELAVKPTNNFFDNLPGLISSIICCLIVVFIIYYLFFRR